MGFFRSRPTMTRSKASSRARIGTLVRFSAEARTAARLRILNRSAPVIPAVRFASVMSSTFLSSTSFAAYNCRMSMRPLRSGIGTTTCLSSRPGRVSAWSSDSAKLVAQMTTTPLLVSNPSSSTSSWFRLILCAAWSILFLFAPTASISSMKTMHGACFRASWKRSRMRRAPTPTNISSNSEPETWRKGTPASPAMARARSVLPVPGGPDISTPFGSFAPRRVKRSGSLRYKMISCSSSFTSSMPFTSSNVVVTSSTGTVFLELPPNFFDMLPTMLSAKTEMPATRMRNVKVDRRSSQKAPLLLISATETWSGSDVGILSSTVRGMLPAIAWAAAAPLDVCEATPRATSRQFLRRTRSKST
mmetsp:Transcript_73819/g.190512  ORF Transcript_73819/g.190512 Transcript_73819/m.190512 type:complete len:361 (-) Transcript_73819:503-1585(-)